MSALQKREFGSRVPPVQMTGAERGRAIDLVHLSRQTLGDRSLELELLGLFERQAAQIVAQLAMPASACDSRRRHDLAHTLKGSARAVGAGQVASAAQAYEDALHGQAGNQTALILAQDRLADAVAEARAAVAALLAD